MQLLKENEVRVADRVETEEPQEVWVHSHGLFQTQLIQPKEKVFSPDEQESLFLRTSNLDQRALDNVLKKGCRLENVNEEQLKLLSMLVSGLAY